MIVLVSSPAQPAPGETGAGLSQVRDWSLVPAPQVEAEEHVVASVQEDQPPSTPPTEENSLNNNGPKVQPKPMRLTAVCGADDLKGLRAVHVLDQGVGAPPVAHLRVGAGGVGRGRPGEVVLDGGPGQEVAVKVGDDKVAPAVSAVLRIRIVEVDPGVAGGGHGHI